MAWVLLLLLFALTIQPAFAASDPPGATINAVGIGLGAELFDYDGTTHIGTLPGVGTMAHVGQWVQYEITLFVPVPPQISGIGANFYAGDLYITFPDGTENHQSPISATQGSPVTSSNVYTWVVTNKYQIRAQDKNLATGYWTAYADYGNTTRYPTAAFGFYKSDPEQETASATTSHTFSGPGQLEVNKVISLGSVVNSTGINTSFTVNVTGPSYPTPGHNLTFNVVSGVVINSPQTLNDLATGSYTISEPSPGPGWSASGGGGVTLSALNSSGNTTITNTYHPGSLQVIKQVNLNNAGPDGISGNFSVTVTGASYPSGISHVFHLVNGVLASGDSPWVLNNLIVGPYTVTEGNPGSAWSVSILNDGNVTVNSDQQATSIVTNSYVVPHTTIQSMTALPMTLPPGGGEVTVTVVDKNDGTIPITGAYFMLDSNPALPGLPHLMTPSGDDGNGTLDPNESWTFTYNVFVPNYALFTAVGHGFVGNFDVTGPSETGTAAVNTPVPANSNLSIWLMVAGLTGAIVVFGLLRRRHSKLSR